MKHFKDALRLFLNKVTQTNKFNFYYHVFNQKNFDLMVESFASRVVLVEQPILTNFHRLILIMQSCCYLT
jgi:hypothetical protein